MNPMKMCRLPIILETHVLTRLLKSTGSERRTSSPSLDRDSLAIRPPPLSISIVRHHQNNVIKLAIHQYVELHARIVFRIVSIYRNTN